MIKISDGGSIVLSQAQGPPEQGTLTTQVSAHEGGPGQHGLCLFHIQVFVHVLSLVKNTLYQPSYTPFINHYPCDLPLKI